MTLVQLENLTLDHSPPQWKRELMNRKRMSIVRAGTNQTNISFGQIVSKQRDVIAANERAVDRQPDFHLQQRESLGSQQLFSPAVSNMKLLNEVGVRDSTVKSRARVNSSRTDCIRENYVKHVIEMNEEKCFARNKFPSRAKIRSLSPPKEDNSDSSEELQYGPGIVNKLKTKYMSMTLRDNQKKGVRPSLSNLRKASSLDNLLDDEIMDESKTYQISSVISCVNKLEYSNKESSSCVTVNFSTDLKRARSMETLQDEKSPTNIKSVVVSKTKVTNHTKPASVYDNGLSIPLDSIVNEDIIIVENSISEVKPEEKQRRNFLENKELPPPDVVKETLKIFETCQKKPTVKSWRQTKSESPKKSSAKPLLYPKPMLDKKVTITKNEENGCEENSPLKNGHHERTSLSSIKVNFESKTDSQHHTTLSHTTTTCICNDKNSINVKTSAILTSEVTLNGNGASCPSPSPKKSPAPQPPRENGDLKSPSSEAECKYRGILKPVDVLPVRQVGIIRPLVAPVKQLTPQEIEKNFINMKKTLDAEKLNGSGAKVDPVPSPPPLAPSVAVKDEDKSCSNVSKPSALWLKKPWNQQQNTMVFNFKDRKEVPDYIENDGLLLTTNRDRAKRILQEGGGAAGYIILGVENGLENSTANESSTDSPSVMCQDEWQMISGPPSPCNIRFEGDNVVINGKSNLRKYPREKKLRIQFNDTSTTFEYPSETSLLEEDLHNVSTCDDDPAAASPLAFSSPELLTGHVPCSGPKMHSPLSGGSGLARYVPSKLGMGESFELGVTKSSSSVTSDSSSTATTNLPNGCDQVDSSVSSSPAENANDYLPAAESENVAWSEESIPDLLF